MRICINEKNELFIAKTYSAFVISGCEAEIICDNPDYTLYSIDETIIIESKETKERISWIKDRDTTIRLNKKISERYIHILFGDNNRVLEAYVTDKNIDPWIFAGIYTCLLNKLNNRQRSFIEAFTILSLGEGSLSTYSEKIRSEHACLHRIIQAVNRLIEKKLLDKLLFKTLIITCRGTSNNVYVVEIHRLSHGFIVDFPKIINTKLYPDMDEHPTQSSLICGLEKDILDKASSKRVNLLVFQDKKCLFSEDPVRNIVSLEKIIS